jgi:hypothetical protein
VTDQISRGAARLATVLALPAALLAGVLVFAGLGGFDRDEAAPQGTPTIAAPTAPQPTTPVPMTATPLSPRAEAVCRAFVSTLPAALRDRARRPVTAGPNQNAAYGEPPITVACAAPAASYPPTDRVNLLDRVCWHAAQESAVTVWTTVDRDVPIRVTVPRAYEQPGQWVIELSPPVAAAVPTAPTIPSGCR